MSATTTHRSERNSNPKPQGPDFTVDNHGSILVLTGNSKECREWIEARVGDDQTRTWGQHGIVVEPRALQGI